MNKWEANNRRDCGNKKAFPSYRLASEFNHRQSKRGGVFAAKGKKLEKLHVYRCTNCGDYHIGHATRHRRSGGRLLPPRQYGRYYPQVEEHQTEE